MGPGRLRGMDSERGWVNAVKGSYTTLTPVRQEAWLTRRPNEGRQFAGAEVEAPRKPAGSAKPLCGSLSKLGRSGSARGLRPAVSGLRGFAARVKLVPVQGLLQTPLTNMQGA